MRSFSDMVPKGLPRQALLVACALAGSCVAGWPMDAVAQTGPAPAASDSAPKASEAPRQAELASKPKLASKSKPAGRPKPVSKPKPDPYGSPLDTLMSTHLWADVPPAEPFVKETRPDPESLHYTPLTGADPTRPKPRDPAGIAALQAELEAGGTRNAARAKGLQSPAKAARRSRKGSAGTSAAR